MNILGIDMGTTTISAVALDGDTRAVLRAETRPAAPFLPAPGGYERAQDAEDAADRAMALAGALIREYRPAAIGLTGQMHGVVPVDGAGRALGPLYTWQDGRGDVDEGEGPLARRLSEELGLPLATGYGLVTHVFNRRHGLHGDAAALATIGAYVGMRLTGRKTPLLHASDAASLGGYRANKHEFDVRALSLSGGALPESTPLGAWLGEPAEGVPVAVSIGDNQASFLGAAEEPDRALLANIGTGAQISACVDRYVAGDAFDTRPFTAGKYLLVNSPLCGGRSYAILEKFLRACAALAGAEVKEPIYEAMNRLALEADAGGLRVDPRFAGTRREPDRRGVISGLSEENFTPARLIRATLEGMAGELYEGYQAMKPFLRDAPARLTASGNAVRRNPALQRILGETFGLPVALSPWREEAARGAALFALALLRGEAV